MSAQYCRKSDPVLEENKEAKIRTVYPHSFFAYPDPAIFLNADPDPDPAAILIRI